MRYDEESAIMRPGPRRYTQFGDPKVFYAKNAQRTRLNSISLTLSLILPWLLFIFAFTFMSFFLHERSLAALWVIEITGLLVAIGFAGLAFKMWAARMQSNPAEGPGPEPSWFTFIAITMLIAWVCGIILGNTNYHTYSSPYYDLKHLNTYEDVNPAKVLGQSLMDAGRIKFSNNSVLDIRKSMGFKNLDTYCVAPISISIDKLTPQGSPVEDNPQPLASYDYWAVGLDCCTGNFNDFHCGDFNNPSAHSGLRLLNDDQRPFFRLAVQQAQATYAIKATHPLFFYWVQDAEAAMNSHRAEAYKYLLIGMMVHLAFQMLCVSLAAIAFSKMSPYTS